MYCCACVLPPSRNTFPVPAGVRELEADGASTAMDSTAASPPLYDVDVQRERTSGDQTQKSDYRLHVIDVSDRRARKDATCDAVMSSISSTFTSVVRPLIDEVTPPAVSSAAQAARLMHPQGTVVVDGSVGARRDMLLDPYAGLLVSSIREVASRATTRALFLSAVELDEHNQLVDLLGPSSARDNSGSDGAAQVEPAPIRPRVPTVIEDANDHFTAIEETTFENVMGHGGHDVLRYLSQKLSEHRHQVFSLVFLHRNGVPNTTLQFVSLVLYEQTRGLRASRHCICNAASLLESRSQAITYTATKTLFLLKPLLTGKQPGAWLSVLQPMHGREAFKDAFTIVQTLHRVSGIKNAGGVPCLLGAAIACSPQTAASRGSSRGPSAEPLPVESVKIPIPTQAQGQNAPKPAAQPPASASYDDDDDAPVPYSATVCPTPTSHRSLNVTATGGNTISTLGVVGTKRSSQPAPHAAKAAPASDSKRSAPAARTVSGVVAPEDDELVELQRRIDTAEKKKMAAEMRQRLRALESALTNEASANNSMTARPFEFVSGVDVSQISRESGVRHRAVTPKSPAASGRSGERNQQVVVRSKSAVHARKGDSRRSDDPAHVGAVHPSPVLVAVGGGTDATVPAGSSSDGAAGGAAGSATVDAAKFDDVLHNYETYKHTMEGALARLRNEIVKLHGQLDDTKKQLKLKERSLRSGHLDASQVARELEANAKKVQALQDELHRAQGEHHQQRAAWKQQRAELAKQNEVHQRAINDHLEVINGLEGQLSKAREAAYSRTRGLTSSAMVSTTISGLVHVSNDAAIARMVAADGGAGSFGEFSSSASNMRATAIVASSQHNKASPAAPPVGGIPRGTQTAFPTSVELHSELEEAVLRLREMEDTMRSTQHENTLILQREQSMQLRIVELEQEIRNGESREVTLKMQLLKTEQTLRLERQEAERQRREKENNSLSVAVQATTTPELQDILIQDLEVANRQLTTRQKVLESEVAFLKTSVENEVTNTAALKSAYERALELAETDLAEQKQSQSDSLAAFERERSEWRVAESALVSRVEALNQEAEEVRSLCKELESQLSVMREAAGRPPWDATSDTEVMQAVAGDYHHVHASVLSQHPAVGYEQQQFHPHPHQSFRQEGGGVLVDYIASQRSMNISPQSATSSSQLQMVGGNEMLASIPVPRVYHQRRTSPPSQVTNSAEGAAAKPRLSRLQPPAPPNTATVQQSSHSPAGQKKQYPPSVSPPSALKRPAEGASKPLRDTSMGSPQSARVSLSPSPSASTVHLQRWSSTTQQPRTAGGVPQQLSAQYAGGGGGGSSTPMSLREMREGSAVSSMWASPTATPSAATAVLRAPSNNSPSPPAPEIEASPNTQFQHYFKQDPRMQLQSQRSTASVASPGPLTRNGAAAQRLGAAAPRTGGGGILGGGILKGRR